MREFKIDGIYVNKIHVYVWDEVENPKGVMQIVHGLNEYGERYTDYAKYLNDKGYIVYVSDHVSHGKTRVMPINPVFHIDHEKGVRALVDGAFQTYKYIKSNHPNLKHIVFGHSLGSMITRYMLERRGCEFDGIILSGALHLQLPNNFFTRKAIRMVKNAYKNRWFLKTHRTSNLIDFTVLTTTRFSRSGRKNNIKNHIEWSTSDKFWSEINANDVHLNRKTSVKAYFTMLMLILEVDNPMFIENIPKSSKVLIVSGKHDPVGQYGKAIKQMANSFEKRGLAELTLKIYEEGRHEMLLEKNRDEVMDYINDWIDNIVYQK